MPGLRSITSYSRSEVLSAGASAVPAAGAGRTAIDAYGVCAARNRSRALRRSMACLRGSATTALTTASTEALGWPSLGTWPHEVAEAMEHHDRADWLDSVAHPSVDEDGKIDG